MNTYTTHTPTPDNHPYTSEVVIDTTLVRAAQRAANAKMGAVPTLSHQLYLLKKGSGRPYTQPKKPRHEAVPCQRCGNVTVLVNRLAIFPAEVTLPCGHRVNLKAGPELVMDAALFRTDNKRRALEALKKALVPQWPGEGLVFGPQPVRLLKPAPLMDKPRHWLTGQPTQDNPPSTPANGETAPDSAPAPQARKSPPPEAELDQEQNPLASSPAAQQTPDSRSAPPASGATGPGTLQKPQI